MKGVPQATLDASRRASRRRRQQSGPARSTARSRSRQGGEADRQCLSRDAINALGKEAELEGKNARSFPLRFADGAVFLGPIKVGQIPPLF
jgi:hypothetical protein